MNLIDLLVVLLLLFGVIAGARAGLLGPMLGLLGGVAGLGVTLALASLLRPVLAAVDQPARALLTLLTLVFLVLGGEALGAGAGASLSHRVRSSPIRPFDMLGGAAMGVAHVALVVWIGAGVLAAGLAPSLAAEARDSLSVRVVSEQLPPPGLVAGRLLALLDTTELPQLFAGLEPPPAPPVELPTNAGTRALAESALASTVRVTGSGCGVFDQVGSGFFVNGSQAITNAHVVAGTTETTVSVAGSTLEASVVLFDPQADLALLHVPGANAPPLDLAGRDPDRGTLAAVLGYPGGGPLTVAPAAVTASYDVSGPDIYGEERSTRRVVEIRSDVQRGNSGGPLVTAPGVAGGVVFGASRMTSEVGYAISASLAAAVISPALGETRPVDTGPCT